MLLVITLLSLAGYSYSEYMFSEYRGTRVRATGAGTAGGGVGRREHEGVLDARQGDDQSSQRHVRKPALFPNDPGAQSDSDRDRCRFAVLAPIEDDDGAEHSLRTEDESTRLNVNASVLESIGKQISEVNALVTGEEPSESPGRDLLMALPGMTEDTADAILDFIDADEEPREFGCESDHYSQQSPPYRAAMVR